MNSVVRLGHHILDLSPSGSPTLRNKLIGESMHSRLGALEEAKLLYIEQSGLRSRLLLDSPNEGERSEPPSLVLWDVGMGIAINALAAIEVQREAIRQGQKTRRLGIVSFENDLDGLHTALSLAEYFPLVASNREPLEALVRSGTWSEDGIDWRLVPGDFLKTAFNGELPRPDLIYYDFYSPKTSGPLWGIRVFSAIIKLVGRTPSAGGTAADLYTYSSATRVRVALLLAGFAVGEGRSTQQKASTTHATNCPSNLAAPLGVSWLEKLSRSTRVCPDDLIDDLGAELSVDEVLLRVRTCPQFNSPVTMGR